MRELIVVRWPGNTEQWWRWDQARYAFNKQPTCCYRHATSWPMTAAWARPPYPRKVQLLLDYYQTLEAVRA